jgi:putative drug exporter of the RND superfamily
MTVVPAVMSMLGDRAWWLPKRLERMLPDLDIKGDQLQRRLITAAVDRGWRGSACLRWSER